MTLSFIGNLSLYIASFCCFVGIFKNRWQQFFFLHSALLPLVSFSILLHLFISSDMSVKNVFLNSSSTLPLIYKISASWASHESSLLLWLALLGIVNVIYVTLLLSGQKILACKLSPFYTIFCFIELLFLISIIYTSNPFETFNFTPQSGLGLNPMLQDVAILIHPPILYLGNVLFSPIFISTIILSSTVTQNSILAFNQKLLCVALSILTLGIGLGSWWAYRELGWGGYWFFDPVENISLMPWLTGIILHHYLILYQKDNSYQTHNIILLSLLSFLMILYGMFIVRSGIISSIHSFAFSQQRGLFLFIICLATTIIALYIFLSLPTKKKHKDIKNSQTILVNISSIFWVIALFLIIISLIYPIYCYLYHAAEVSIDENYFYRLFIPLFIPLLFLASFVAQNNAKLISKFKNNITQSLNIMLLLIVSISIALLISYRAHFSLISFLILVASIYLCLSMIYYVVNTTSYFTKSLTRHKLALLLTHFGFGLLALSINLNVNFVEKIDFSGTINDQAQSSNKIVTLENIKFAQNDNYYRQIAIFKVEHGNNHVILKPENRLYKIENSLSQEADIYSYLFQDIYAVISRVKGEIVEAQIYFQPFIIFIWLSILMISLGFLISACGKRTLYVSISADYHKTS
ncbi:MAG: heme lyase CcmF/NrfE family subunit [Rickettsiaceae bacterium]|nr:heme lyase CcmF/NrfE family subunit [Rickettsiaceae bacterium]